MAVRIFQPTATKSNTGWTASSGTIHDAVDPGDPVSHGGATVSIGSSPGVNSFETYHNDALDYMDTITDVSAYIRTRGTGSDFGFWGLTANPGTVFTSGRTYTSSWANYSNTGLSRPGGGSWVQDDFTPNNSCYMYASNNEVGGQTMYVDSLWFEVTFEPVEGTVVMNVAQWLMPLVGAGLTMADWLRVRAEHFRRTLVLWSDDELARLKADFRGRPACAF